MPEHLCRNYFWSIPPPQERVDATRGSLSEGKRNIAGLTEHVQSLQADLAQSELRREELEAELSHTQEVRRSLPEHPAQLTLPPLTFLMRFSHQALRQRAASLVEAQRTAQEAQAERVALQERLRSLQRAVAQLETEKRDAERQAVRLEKDKNALRSTLDKVGGSTGLTEQLGGGHVGG